MRSITAASAIVAVLMVSPIPGGAQSRWGPTLEEQIQAAVQALPTGLRDGAGILQMVGSELQVVRDSDNGISCMVDDPSDDEMDVRCYHDDMWPAVLHSRVFAAQLDASIRGQARRDALYDHMHQAIESGEVVMADRPTAAYRMWGPASAYHWDTGEIEPEMAKWQLIWMPFRTAEELGLPTNREPSEEGLPGFMPFMEASGTWYAHVVIQHEPW